MWELFTSVPVWFQYSVMFMLGAILGSFLDVFLLRFHTGQSINGRSHCLSCGETLRWFELLPVVSYLTQQGRCRMCSAHIPLRLLLMEVFVGVLLVTAFSLASNWFDFILISALALVLLLIALYDVRHCIIPDSLVLVLTVVVMVAAVLTLAPQYAFSQLLDNLYAAIGVFIFFAGLWGVSKGAWIGFGDAKLAAPLAFLLGPWAAFSFVVFSFWIGAVASVGILILQRILKRGQINLLFLSVPYTMKTEVPFAPFMILAFAVVYFGQYDALGLISYLIYGT